MTYDFDGCITSTCLVPGTSTCTTGTSTRSVLSQKVLEFFVGKFKSTSTSTSTSNWIFL
jgi:hypothetical protein